MRATLSSVSSTGAGPPVSAHEMRWSHDIPLSGTDDLLLVEPPSSALPGRLVAHLVVVPRQVLLHLVDVVLRQVHAPATALHHVARGHQPPRDDLELVVD